MGGRGRRGFFGEFFLFGFFFFTLFWGVWLAAGVVCGLGGISARGVEDWVMWWPGVGFEVVMLT